MPKKIILDVDPGHDDAIAILLAKGNPEIELAAITSVAGNQILSKTTYNTLRVATLVGATDIPIAAGAEFPLVRDQITDADSIAGSVHGESGLDGPVLPEPAMELDPRHAAQLIIDLVMAGEPGEYTLVPTGPLTNIALAMRLQPEIVTRVKEVVLMGGAYTQGNVTPAAEFNILADAEAAAAVFNADWQVTMVGLDLTHQAVATPEIRERIRAIDTDISRVVDEWLDFFGANYDSVWKMPYPPIHDACAVARVISADIVKAEKAFITVETAGKWTYGETVTDFLGAYGLPFNNLAATELDFDAFWDLIIDAIKTVSKS
ncbi:Pyrimidine-specific ribonucleoside hydrolase RihB [Arthrobacter sp. Bi83]|uniref:nucleoside hydrolase n=1 Tax=Arthrobacter sp. Bi83 TaxID=2822353 RepID=UPI001D565867|nr:nucleoside hydrolase [Arthrobacter sp. Bi83]CAH0125448.1 Pyrimidine-specific ribonucleoside hydrolase RihB [Arthrobacter sp. Bi83]